MLKKIILTSVLILSIIGCNKYDDMTDMLGGVNQKAKVKDFTQSNVNHILGTQNVPLVKDSYSALGTYYGIIDYETVKLTGLLAINEFKRTRIGFFYNGKLHEYIDVDKNNKPIRIGYGSSWHTDPKWLKYPTFYDLTADLNKKSKLKDIDKDSLNCLITYLKAHDGESIYWLTDNDSKKNGLYRFSSKYINLKIIADYNDGILGDYVEFDSDYNVIGFGSGIDKVTKNNFHNSSHKYKTLYEVFDDITNSSSKIDDKDFFYSRVFTKVEFIHPRDLKEDHYYDGVYALSYYDKDYNSGSLYLLFEKNKLKKFIVLDKNNSISRSGLGELTLETSNGNITIK